MSIRVVFITAPNEEVGATLARSLVEERLAACVNLVPGIRSIYRWQGKIEDEAEVLLVVKTQVDKLQALTDRVIELHPYTVPEVIAAAIEAGNPTYLEWVRTETA